MARTPSSPASAILLVLAGITLIGKGFHFLLLRPPLLPEDVHFMGLNDAQLVAVGPRLEAWLPMCLASWAFTSGRVACWLQLLPQRVAGRRSGGKLRTGGEQISRISPRR